MPSTRKKAKIRFSELLSYAGCARPRTSEESNLDGSSGHNRLVYINDPNRLNKYPSNYISTTKYNLLTFFPRALAEQFRRVANIYFLLAACLGLTPLSPYEASSLIAPLVLVIGVSMIKEAIEDYKRWQADQEVNKRPVLVYVGEGRFESKQWQKLQVGDIVQVTKDSFFPADLFVLSSSMPDGVCYVETMNLDGETNLKLRIALERTLPFHEDAKMAEFKAHIQCEDPNPSLYTFVGNLDFEGQTEAITPQQVLLRDSKLRNTAFVYGVVIFTGHDTKVMQNSTATRSKRSRIEKRMDSIIYLLFGILLTLATVGSIVFGIRTKNETGDWWYLRPDDITVYFDPKKAALAAILQAITDLILYGYLIPISLYVSLEIVKVCQAIFMSQDIEMYYEVTDTPARVRTTNLNEELGQVDTILSDKTGTLTCNQMDFRKCSIAGVAYGKGITQVEEATALRLGKDLRELEEYEPPGSSDASKKKVKGFAFHDKRIMEGNWIHEDNLEDIRMFLRILAVCNTAIPDVNESTGEISYEAESPDEAAFVVSAKQMGFEFVSRAQSTVVVREPSVENSMKPFEREYEILHVLEFNSTRKRMSVVVRDSDGQIMIMCKGADSVIFERLSTSGRTYLDATRAHLARYGEAGLRTLALAYRYLDANEYEEWKKEFLAAKTSLTGNRESLIDEASEKIEQNLCLVGATAVEDKLQDGVPESIDKLAKAGIKIWVLTGDKQETAINIGYACNLLRDGMTQIIISLDTPEIRELEETYDKELIKSRCTSRVAKQITDGATQIQDNRDPDTVFALVIDGKSLAYALDERLKAVLLALAMRCASVICCRVSPKQKAMVTRLVKKGTGKVTLGIGDGANDVGMIQEADIGVGISGVEGQQAVMASDFAIGQFRFLERLLLVHGHWCYKRIANMITYFFYKNLAFGMTLFYYNGYAMFSGQIMYNSWYSAVYNVFFTSLPVFALGILEQDVRAKTCLSFPILYQSGPRNEWFTWKRIIFWMLNGIYVSVVGFWFTMLALNPQAYSNGFLPELPGLGFALFTVTVWTVNTQLFLTLEYITWVHHLLIWGSIGFFYLFAVVYGYVTPSFSTTGYRLFTEESAPSPSYWFVTLLIPLAQLLPYFVYKSMRVRFSPMDHEIVQELAAKKVDMEDPSVWKAEGARAIQKTDIGFSAAVDNVVKRMSRKGKLKLRKVPPPGSVLEVARQTASEDFNGTSK